VSAKSVLPHFAWNVGKRVPAVSGRTVNAPARIGPRLRPFVQGHSCNHAKCGRTVVPGEVQAAEAPRIVGIDDWALKKGQTYGTILVDWEARRVIDLLPERAALPVAGWLEAHPSIQAVVRDRSSE
jgi:hypothetical protein